MIEPKRKKISGRNGYNHTLDMTNTHLWAKKYKSLMIKSWEMTKERKVSIHNNFWVGKWGHLTQSKLLRVPNSLGAPFFDGGTWKVGWHHEFTFAVLPFFAQISFILLGIFQNFRRNRQKLYFAGSNFRGFGKNLQKNAKINSLKVEKL